MFGTYSHLRLILGEPIVEPEVDLTTFLARQRLLDDEAPTILSAPSIDKAELEDIDHSLDHIGSGRHKVNTVSKGMTQVIQWDNQLEEMRQDKEAVEAQRGQ
jgi:hypothetical protein